MDYYAVDREAVSPFQHFWSLSIQGQIFILWPLMILGCALIARKLGLSLRGLSAGVFGFIFVCSLAFSIHQTHTNQAFAYFDTRTRLWEFALGSLVALVIPYIRPGKLSSVALGWMGLLGMLSVGMVVQVQHAFPGYIALAPILAACAVIIAGQSGSPAGADRLLSSRPLIALGKASYALYLVHWPILILTLMVQGKDQADFATGTAIVLVSIALAFLITRIIETPIRNSQWVDARLARGTAVLVALILVVLVPVLGWKWDLQQRISAVQRADISQDNPGAWVLLDQYRQPQEIDAPAIPAPEIAAKDWARLDGPCRDDSAPDPTPGDYELCFETGPVDAEKTVVVVGSSHPRQMAPAYAELAKQENWRLLSITRGSCTYGVHNVQREDECNDWNAQVRDYLLELSPDLVVLQSTMASKDSTEEILPLDFESSVRELTDSGIEVLGVRDNPRFTINLVECAVTHGEDSPKCTFPVGEKLAAVNPARALENIDGYHNVDFTDTYCPSGQCRPVVGNVYVYMDYNHVSTPYSRSMSGALREQLWERLKWPGLESSVAM